VNLIPDNFDARTRAQEYGGGAFAIKDDIIIFSNYKDQRLYKHSIGGRIDTTFLFVRTKNKEMKPALYAYRKGFLEGRLESKASLLTYIYL
jgi:hypothetical protein